MSNIVYLAGPITGLDYEGSTEWRDFAIQCLGDYGIEGVSPMRGKDFLANEKSIGDSYEESPMSCARGIYTRDKFDCMRCDVLLVNLLGAKKVSIGTVIEIAWADAVGIPIVLVIEKEGNLHDHSMIRESTGFRVDNLEAALKIIKVMLA